MVGFRFRNVLRTFLSEPMYFSTTSGGSFGNVRFRSSSIWLKHGFG